MPNNPAVIGDYRCGRAQPLLVVAGPCVIEDAPLTATIAHHLAEIASARLKESSRFPTARTSGSAYRGPGLRQGLEILAAVRETTGLPVTTDIHLPEQARPVGEVCELIQIPAFLARQTDLLLAAAATGRAVHVKNAQFMSPSDMRHVVTKLSAAGCNDILLCERGTFFGYGRLVNDMRAIPQMQSLGVPVVFDATHSVQEPGGLGDATGGNRELVAPLARAAMALCADGIFCETHPRPDESPSDGANMVPLEEMANLLSQLIEIRDVAARFASLPSTPNV